MNEQWLLTALAALGISAGLWSMLFAGRSRSGSTNDQTPKRPPVLRSLSGLVLLFWGVYFLSRLAGQLNLTIAATGALLAAVLALLIVWGKTKR